MEVIKRKIKKHLLEFDKTLPYFLDHIGSGGTLSEKLIERVDFKLGSFFTLLPLNAVLERLFEFPSGGIIPSIPYGSPINLNDNSSESFQPTQVITVARECSEFVGNYLREGVGNYAFVEDCLLEFDNQSVEVNNVKITPYEKEVYYLLDSGNTENEIYETIRKSGHVWHSLSVLTVVGNKPLYLTDADLNRICDNTKFVIAGAYDGEGYIFWKKN